MRARIANRTRACVRLWRRSVAAGHYTTMQPVSVRLSLSLSVHTCVYVRIYLRVVCGCCTFPDNHTYIRRDPAQSYIADVLQDTSLYPLPIALSRHSTLSQTRTCRHRSDRGHTNHLLFIAVSRSYR